MGIQLAETIPLVVNRPDNQYQCINLYVDDQGTIKGLPVNPRATQIAQMCGLLLEVRGDAFIARFVDDEDTFLRQDFTLADLSSSAPWVTAARAFNLEKQKRAGSAQETLASLGLPSSGTVVRPGADHSTPTTTTTATTSTSTLTRTSVTPSEAERARLAGNRAFGKGDYQGAIERYKVGLAALDTENTENMDETDREKQRELLLMNRALAWLKTGEYAATMADCDEVLKGNPSRVGYVKALLRRVEARRLLLFPGEMMKSPRPGGEEEIESSRPSGGQEWRAQQQGDLENVLRVEPQNQDAKRLWSQCGLPENVGLS